MTLPANDAFTLGHLKHDSSHPVLHTSSPKLFPKTIKSASSSGTKNARSSMSPGRANGSATLTRRQVQHPNGHAGPQPGKKDKLIKSAQDVPAPIDWEIPRKTLHSSIGFLTLYLYASHGSPQPVVVALSTGLAIIVPCDILRLRSARFERLFERCVGFLMRESEKKRSNGVIWYMLGVIFVLSVYPLDIAVVSILILSWADTAASTLGRLFGSRTPSLPNRTPLLGLPLASRKSVAGFIAASVTGACIAIGFWGWLVPFTSPISSWRWPAAPAISDSPAATTGGFVGLGVLGIVSGLISGVAEALDLGSLDDNLTLPIISGGCLWGFFKFLELFAA